MYDLLFGEGPDWGGESCPKIYRKNKQCKWTSMNDIIIWTSLLQK